VTRRKQRGVPKLGERIKRIMEFLNLDASELSARTGISGSYLSRILKGTVVNPTIDFVTRIADGLGVTETELVRDVTVKGFTPAMAEAFGSGPGLGSIPPRSSTGQQQIETNLQQRNQNIELLVVQIVAEAKLPLTPEKRRLAERLILETVRTVCEVLAEE
jgi:transcriptional regulator with XRE-family HTH domain